MRSLVLIAGLLTILVTVLPANGASTEVSDAIRLASVTYGVPEAEMRAVAWCESRMNPRAANPSSSARGLFQFLTTPKGGTWGRTPYARLDVFNPYANALAAGWLYVKSGRSWSPWSCRPR